MFTSRPAARIDTEKPDRTSTSEISISVKNTECAAPLTSRNSTRKATNTKVDSKWSMTEELEVRVDFTTSTNSRTRPIATSTSLSVMVKTPPDIIGMENNSV